VEAGASQTIYLNSTKIFRSSSRQPHRTTFENTRNINPLYINRDTGAQSSRGAPNSSSGSAFEGIGATQSAPTRKDKVPLTLFRSGLRSSSGSQPPSSLGFAHNFQVRKPRMASTTIPPTTEPATIPPIFLELGGVGVVVGVFCQNLGKRENTVVEEAELPEALRLIVVGLPFAVVDAYGIAERGT
jgi:hypothetical protein